MKFITIKTKEYYNHPEFYAFMPPSIFNALELAELEGSQNGQEISADVPEDDFLKMLKELTDHQNKLTNGNENS